MDRLIPFTVLLAASLNLYAQSPIFKVPPSSSTSSHVPRISDEAMEKCVILYNKIEWLEGEIDTTHVNRYSQESVDTYNAKIDQFSMMVNIFNSDCAGKQSESAYRAAQKLNNN